MDPLLTLPHLPVILFLSGALALSLGGTKIPAFIRNGLAITICLIAGGLLALMNSYLPIDIVFSDWLVNLTLFGSLIYRIDNLNWIFAVGLVSLNLVTIIGWITTEDRRRSIQLISGLFVISAGAFSLFFSGNLLTLTLSWAFLIAAFLLFYSFFLEDHRPVCHILIIWAVGAFVLLLATWNVGWGDGGRWIELTDFPIAVVAIFIVAWIALGAYPLHLWLPLREASMDAVLSFSHAIPPLFGLYLLARLSILQVSLPFQEFWMGLGSVALLLGSILAWSQRNRARALSYLGIAQAGGVVFAVALTLPESFALVWSWSAFLPFSLLILFHVPSWIGKHVPSWVNWLLRIVTGLAGACLVGLPPTAGFIAWSQLNDAILSREQTLVTVLLFGVVILSIVLIAATFFNIWLIFPPSRTRLKGLLLRAGAGLLLVLPALASGLWPGKGIDYLAGSDWMDWGMRDYSSITIGLWATSLLSIVIGFSLSLWPPASLASSNSVWRLIVRIWSLDWACTVVERLGRVSANVLDTLADMLNGEHYLLWALLALLLFWTLYLFF